MTTDKKVCVSSTNSTAVHSLPLSIQVSKPMTSAQTQRQISKLCTPHVLIVTTRSLWCVSLLPGSCAILARGVVSFPDPVPHACVALCAYHVNACICGYHVETPKCDISRIGHQKC